MNVRVTTPPAATAAHVVEGTLPQHGMGTERPTLRDSISVSSFGFSRRAAHLLPVGAKEIDCAVRERRGRAISARTQAQMLWFSS